MECTWLSDQTVSGCALWPEFRFTTGPRPSAMTKLGRDMGCERHEWIEERDAMGDAQHDGGSLRVLHKETGNTRMRGHKSRKDRMRVVQSQGCNRSGLRERDKEPREARMRRHEAREARMRVGQSFGSCNFRKPARGVLLFQRAGYFPIVGGGGPFFLSLVFSSSSFIRFASCSARIRCAAWCSRI